MRSILGAIKEMTTKQNDAAPRGYESRVHKPVSPQSQARASKRLATPDPIFKAAYEAAVEAIGEPAWSRLSSREQGRVIYREMRRIDREAWALAERLGATS